MVKGIIRPGKNVTGTIKIPPSKSQTHRAILFASLAKGSSVVTNFLNSPDSEAMISACRQLGANITVQEEKLLIQGTNGQIIPPTDVIDAHNSGIVLRFVSAVSALSELPIVITGDHSIRTQRPMGDLLKALQLLGVQALSTRNNGFAPLIIQGPITKKNTRLEGSDSQPVSALLILGAFYLFP